MIHVYLSQVARDKRTKKKNLTRTNIDERGNAKRKTKKQIFRGTDDFHNEINDGR